MDISYKEEIYQGGDRKATGIADLIAPEKNLPALINFGTSVLHVKVHVIMLLLELIVTINPNWT